MKFSFNVAAIILCGGSGQRAKLGYNKVLHAFSDGKTSAEITTSKFMFADTVIVVYPAADKAEFFEMFDGSDIILTEGGKTRTDSVRAALKKVPANTDIITIHDGARPFVSEKVIASSILTAHEKGSGIAAIAQVNALRRKLTDGNTLSANREQFFSVQTPQSFDARRIIEAYAAVDGTFSDDAEVFEKAGNAVFLSEGDENNVKLTNYRDFAMLGSDMRVGFGFDVHELTTGRDLILCGKKLDYPLGLMGHSDADVAVHAVMDALLSAAGLSDIGALFPDTDPKYEGADSIELLREVRKKLADYNICNVSLMIIAQKPKLLPHRADFITNLAAALEIDASLVNVSATTTEFLGIIGEGKGIAAACDVLIKRNIL